MRSAALRNEIPIGTVQRLCVYRRILFSWSLQGKHTFFSHELAAEADYTAAQVRRDMMALDTAGTPKRGYSTLDIIAELGAIVEGEEGQNIVLVGLGNLGIAILNYFVNRRPDLKIVDVFDNDPKKIGKVFANCQCSYLSDLKEIVARSHASIGILTVPGNVAQQVADSLVEAGIISLVNFTPVKLKVPPDIFVEELDISISLEKAAYFAHKLDSAMQRKSGSHKKKKNPKDKLDLEDVKI